MNKIWTILKREYIIRVRTKLFWVSTFLTPIGFSFLFFFPIFSMQFVEKEKTIVLVSEERGEIFPFFESDDDFVFKKAEIPVDLQTEMLGPNEVSLNIPNTATTREGRPLFLVRGDSKISLQVEEGLKGRGMKAFRKYQMNKLDISFEEMEKINRKPDWTFKTGDAETSAIAATLAGYGMSMVIYILLFTYGTILMKGVIEEKTNRIMEIMVSTVRPFQLMMGKILGIGAVGITQLSLVLILVSGSVFIGSLVAGKTMDLSQVETSQLSSGDMEMEKIEGMITEVKKVFSIQNVLLFLIYFFGGYLLYGSLFAAVGSAVDQEADTQTLVWPLTIPLIIPMLLLPNIMQNPNGTISVFSSLFPFFSPIVMVIRVVSGEVPLYQIFLSIVFLILGFLCTTWIASRIYRVGILMYGKRPSFKEIFKWMVYYS